MLKVDQVSVIRDRYFNLRQSVRRIAKELGVSRNTVKKYLGESEPSRKQRTAKERPVREKAEERVCQLLEEWENRVSKKQAITGTRLHRELQAEGQVVGITTVREIFAEHKREKAEVFIPLVHRAGEEAQVDFFEVLVDIGGQRQKVWKFLVRLMYSGRDFTWLYRFCDQVSFLDGHVRAFAHFGGIPWRLVYDNLKPAVKKIVMGERKLTVRFQALVSHYTFRHSFCRPGEGHDKGGVEARGKGIRLEHMTPIPQAESLELAALQLLAGIDERLDQRRDAQGRSTLERFREELVMFKALPAAGFEPRKPVPVSVTSQATVRIEGAVYSVPEAWARLSATAYVGPEDIHVTCRGEMAVKARVGKGTKNIEYYRHYLRELSRKPQALGQVAPELLGEMGEPFEKLWKLLEAAHGPEDAARAFSRVLGAILAHGEAPVREAVSVAVETDKADLLGLGSQLHGPVVRAVPVPAALAGIEVEQGRASDYDHLLEVGQ